MLRTYYIFEHNNLAWNKYVDWSFNTPMICIELDRSKYRVTVFLHIGMWSSDHCLNEFSLGMPNSAPLLSHCRAVRDVAILRSGKLLEYDEGQGHYQAGSAASVRCCDTPKSVVRCGAPRRVASQVEWMKSRHLRWTFESKRVKHQTVQLISFRATDGGTLGDTSSCDLTSRRQMLVEDRFYSGEQ